MNHVTDERADRPLDSRLHDWIGETIEELPDGAELPPSIRSDVLSRLPGTPQRQRWWPFRWHPFGIGETRSADPEEPHPEGRPRSMFNAIRVAVVVAALALVGSLAYMAAPTDESTLEPGAPVRDASEFIGFTGTFKAVNCNGGEMTVFDWGLTLEGDYCSPMKLDVSDERLSGTARATHNVVNFQAGKGFGVRTLRTEIVNDGGTWEGTGIAFHDPDEDVMRYEFLLSGRDGYEGLSAMLSLVSDTNFINHEAQGVVFPGELPKYPAFDGDDPVFEPASRSEIDPADYGGFEGTLRVATGKGGEVTSADGALGPEIRGQHILDMGLETSDPRMTGRQESLINANEFRLARVHTTADRIVTDDGWWDASSWGYQHPETSAMRFVNQMTGHGAYEGLSAIDITSGTNFYGVLDRNGVIFPGELPGYPELPAAE